MLEQMRQWRYPPEHRIAEVKLPPDAVQAIDGLTDAIEEFIRRPPPPPADSVSDSFFVDLCEEVSRLEKRIPEAAATEADRGRLERRLQAVRDLLAQEGVTYRDHTGQSYDTRLNVEVLAIVPHESAAGSGELDGVKGEVIVETVRPTVLRNGKVIVPGSVVVGSPTAAKGASRES